MVSSTVSTNNKHYSPDRMDAAFEDFRKAYPDFDSTRKLDDLRVTEYARLERPDLGVDVGEFEGALKLAQQDSNTLFAYPAQSNFSGVQHPLEWIAEAQSKVWDVLLDAPAFAPSNRLDLSQWQPDFVDLSFYKIFGYPTGIGCLLAHKKTVHKLHRPWYAGGTSSFSSVQGEVFYLRPGPAGFEDGTVNYLSIPAVEMGLRYIESLGIETIHSRVTTLTGWLIDQLMGLKHSNGKLVIRLYGPANMEMRGGTVEVYF